MPKVTVYIPDELWKRVKNSPAANNVSQLVQKSLEGELGVAAPGVDTEVARNIVARMRREARAIYDVGLRDGFDLAANLSWSELDLLRVTGWDIDAWAEADAAASGMGEPRVAGVLDEWRSAHEASLDYEGPDPWQSGGYKEGVLEALRGVWGRVMSDLRNRDDGGVPNA